MTILTDDSIFIHIPKNAGTSISNWLIDNCKGKWYKPKSWQGKHFMLNQLPTPHRIRRNTIFCCVRNPWQRAFSYYNYYKNTENRAVDGLTFEEYVMNTDMAQFKVPQLRYIDPSTIVLRYENLWEDFKIMQEFYDCYKPLDIKNSSGGSIDYKDHYNEDMITKVGLIAAKDIAHFDYKY